jgi:hypothetical protein
MLDGIKKPPTHPTRNTWEGFRDTVISTIPSASAPSTVGVQDAKPVDKFLPFLLNNG